MSLKDEADEAFGPHTPCSYRDIFLRWFSPSDKDEGKTMDYTITVPVPESTSNADVNSTQDNAFNIGNMSINYTSHVMTSHRVDTAS